jgi:hypothetical protein
VIPRRSNERVESVDAPSIGELADLVITYAKQETLNPIRGAGRWLAYGFAAVLSLILGVAMLAIGALRLLQFEVFSESTTWSWIPYLIVMILCVLVVAITLSRIKKDSLHLGGRS